MQSFSSFSFYDPFNGEFVMIFNRDVSGNFRFIFNIQLSAETVHWSVLMQTCHFHF